MQLIVFPRIPVCFCCFFCVFVESLTPVQEDAVNVFCAKKTVSDFWLESRDIVLYCLSWNDYSGDW